MPKTKKARKKGAQNAKSASEIEKTGKNKPNDIFLATKHKTLLF